MAERRPTQLAPVSGALKTVELIRQSFHSVLAALDRTRDMLNAEATYYESLCHSCEQLLSIIDLSPVKGFTKSQYEKQSMWISFCSIHEAITQLQGTLFGTSISAIKAKVGVIGKKMSEFELKSRNHLQDLRKVIHKCENELQAAQKTPLRDSEMVPFDAILAHGSQAHQIALKAIESICEIEQRVVNDVSSLAGFQTELILEEDKIISDVTDRLTEGLPFVDVKKPLPPRVLPEDINIKVIQVEVKALFFDLKCFIGPPTHFSSHKVPRVWKDGPTMKSFHARVWRDYNTVETDEVCIRKKEIVTVLQAPASWYWRVQKADGKQGYVPSEILEPIE